MKRTEMATLKFFFVLGKVWPALLDVTARH